MGIIHATAWRRRYDTPKRLNLMLIWDVEEFIFTGLPDQTHPVLILLVSGKISVRCSKANAGTNEQEIAIPTPKQLSNVKFNNNLDRFKTICEVLRIPKAIESIWARVILLLWLGAFMTSWMYERAKLHMSRNTETYQSFQLNIGLSASERAFRTHRSNVTTAVKRVAR